MAATLAVALFAAFAISDGGAAQAGQPCFIAKGEFCLTLEPPEDTNPVGSEHTVTAVATVDGNPLAEASTLIIVADGPNAGENDIGVTDSNGEFSLTYTGSGGPGTDTIGAFVCLDCGDPEGYLQTFAEKCIALPEKCALYFEECASTPEATLEGAAPTTIGASLCNVATKVWEEAEGPEPTPTATTPPPEGGDVTIEVSDDSVSAGDEVDITAKVVDDNGDPVAGEDCTFTIVSQPGDDASVEAGAVTTNAEGEATTGLDAGTTPGTIQVRADCGAFSDVLDVVVSPALPATGAGGTGSGAMPWPVALLAAAGALALAGTLSLRLRARR